MKLNSKILKIKSSKKILYYIFNLLLIFVKFTVNWRDFSLSGDYRYVIVKPARVDFKILNYNDKTVELTKSDWDLINENENKDLNSNIKEQNQNLKAVYIEYSLPSSSYATVTLREILDDHSKL